MPTGRPDSESDLPEGAETTAERIIREAIEAGDFDDLAGTGKPIPGAGTVDDEMWWVRSWIERNRESGKQKPTERR